MTSPNSHLPASALLFGGDGSGFEPPLDQDHDHGSHPRLPGSSHSMSYDRNIGGTDDYAIGYGSGRVSSPSDERSYSHVGEDDGEQEDHDRSVSPDIEEDDGVDDDEEDEEDEKPVLDHVRPRGSGPASATESGLGSSSRGPTGSTGGGGHKKKDGDGGGVGNAAAAARGDNKDGAENADQSKRKMACMSCRLIKLRCLLHSPTSHPLDPCRRCVKVGIECEYKPKRRPVKSGPKSAGLESARASGSTTTKPQARTFPNAGSDHHQQQPSSSKTTTSGRRRTGKYARASNSPGSSPAPAAVRTVALEHRDLKQQQQHNHFDSLRDPGEIHGTYGFDPQLDASVGGHAYHAGYAQSNQYDYPASSGIGMGGMGAAGADRRESSSAGGTIGSASTGPNGMADFGVNHSGPMARMPDLDDVRRRRQGGISGGVNSNTNVSMSMPTTTSAAHDAVSRDRQISSARSSPSNRPGGTSSFVGGYDFGGGGMVGVGGGGGTGGGSNYGSGLRSTSGHPISSARQGTSIDETADGGGAGYLHEGTSNMRSTGALSAYELTPPNQSGTTSLPPLRRHLSTYSLPVSDVLAHSGTSAMYRPRSETHDLDGTRSSTAGGTDDHPDVDRVDPTNAKTRLPMALASILDLMRKDLSPPPGHVREDADGIAAGRSRDRGEAGSSMKRRRSTEFSSNTHGQVSVDPVTGARAASASHDQSDNAFFSYGDHMLPSGRPEKRTRWEDQQAGKTETRRPGSPSRCSGGDQYRIYQLSETPAADFAQKASESQAASAKRDAGDPVQKGLVTLEEVQFLFSRYFDRHNTYIALLDIALHTPEYCLSTSVVLYVAILAVTANAFLPTRYPGLLAHVNDMLGDAFKRSDVEIGLCQALSLLSVWKEGSDRGSWLRVGYAIRIGYELGLDAQPLRPLPENPLLAKEELNKERTWWQLTMFDRTMYHMHGQRPRMITIENVRDPADWARDHMNHYCYSDSMLAASFTCGRFLSVLAGHRQQEPMSISYRMILHRLQVENSEWAVVWLGADPPAPLHPVSRTIIGFYLHVNNFEISEFGRLGVPDGDSMEALSDSVTNAISLLRYIVDELDPADVLKFAPDVITIRAAKCGVFLARNMNKIPPILVEEIFSVFKQLVRSCKRASHGQDTAYFQAKFFNSLLRVSSVAPTRVGSRIGSPIPSSSHRSATKPLTTMPNGVPGDILAARLSESLPPDPAVPATADPMQGARSQMNEIFDMDLFPFDEQLSIDALLQESHDWFSLDLMSHINDPSWTVQPVVTLPGPYGLTSNDATSHARM